MEIPVYLFTGFLEGGKTTVIQQTLSDPNFNSGERFLLIVCEEGAEEYDPTAFAKPNVYIEYIEDSSMLTDSYLTTLLNKHKCNRVIVEYNGMWLLNDFYQALPENWMVYQEMMFADAGSFETFNTNMRQLTVDKLQSCEAIILNRATDITDKDSIHKIVRAVNRRCSIGYEYESGEFEYDDTKDPLPFDINAPVIEIKDQDFAEWYRDLTEEPEKYDGKTVKFKGIVATSPKLAKNEFAVGRHVMVCCSNDISYCAMVCRYDREISLKTKDWIIVTAKISFGKHKIYSGKGPILSATEIAMTSQPEQPVATFY